MAQEQQRHSQHKHEDDNYIPDPAPEGAASGSAAAQTSDLDSLLDDIDDVLEVNAEEFVSGFVQKGGQ